MAAETLTERDGPIGIIRLNRPETLNTLNLKTFDQIAAAAERFDADGDVRCLLLAGGERAFCAGEDVTELADASAVEVYHRDAARRWERLQQLRKPLVAAVSGQAIGAGCALLLACDIVIAAETARLALPEVGMGALPAGGATQRLTHLAGKARAMDLLLTGRSITAREALAMGLVSRVVPREQYYHEALNVCRDLATRPPLALQMAKAAILHAEQAALRDGLALERSLRHLLFGTADQREGMRAFLEQRPAVFVGR
ncbi:MAG: enoyl-CoA hydratase-related protein [Phycisphaerae bacterium]|jgi:enoyl-CoA hydratase